MIRVGKRRTVLANKINNITTDEVLESQTELSLEGIRFHS